MEPQQTALDQVNRAREAHGLTIAALADRVGDKGGQLYHWLGGKGRRAPLPLRLKVLDLLKLPASCVLDDDEIDLVRMGARAVERERRAERRNGRKTAA